MRFSATIVSLVALASKALAIGQAPSLAFEEVDGGLKLGGTGSAPVIVIDSKDWAGVTRAGNDLANDFGLVTGSKGRVATSANGISGSTPVIIAGTIGKSPLIDNLVSSGKLDVSSTTGKWEAFTSQLVSDPAPGVSSALVLAGSDKRGTIYAIYDISEQIGVSPWYWWADVPPKKKTNIYALPKTKVQGSPSIKYRGIFLNDEQPALTNWVNRNYGRYDSRFYGKVFELLLRLRANYLWPTMWNSRFYVDDSRNGPLADEMGIVMGTSHTEPMARADKEKVKPWDWRSNQWNLKRYMQDGLNRAKNWETLWTLGMRGDGDTASPTLDARSLVDVINYQQSIMKDTLTQNLAKVPQMWCVYKEVGGYYDAGMNIPDDLTILWSDDNSGNIQRLPIASEANREGNAGVYYHFDYVGDPRNYKWINTIQLSKTWEQMHLAWARNATEIWIVNVGDLKPLELPISHFLDMAYDMSSFTSAASTDPWLKAWATREFGSNVADGTAEAMATYGKLIVRRKYELLNLNPFMLSTNNYDEAENVLDEWTALESKAQTLYDSLDSATQIAFFEVVLHPIMAGGVVQRVYINAARNSAYASQNRMSTNKLADDVRATYAQDAVIQRRYHGLLNGKWNHMMDQVHFGYTYWQDPRSNSMPGVRTIGTNAPRDGMLGVSVQNSGGSNPTLQDMSPYTRENRTFEIFARGSGSMDFSIASSEDYVRVSPSSGTVSYPSGTSDIRANIRVNWFAAPKGSSSVTITVTPRSGNAVRLTLPLRNVAVPDGFKGHVESNGAVAMEMAHFSSRESGAGGSSLEVIPNYGRTHSGLTLMPSTAGTQSTGSGPKAVYSFFSYTTASNAKVTVYMPPSFNVDPGHPLKFAVALDGGNPSTVTPIGRYTLGSMPSGWKESVIDGARVVTTNIGRVEPGKHELSLWLLEPGTVVHRLVVDLGGVASSYLGPPESGTVGM
ncbi:hypothetical protein BDW02DRAFT_553559 [Decorospora gaudefroyi]|uniref:Gylcosyl hydrolase 115 C-terminal domain-containing protein n=1 Tax=Decorospora gaudefroyi TaxID=184978 RepID=A0A6A5K9H7_9PLEO|nr:hypothetical protein BDW02DRAFT_553559 [Decorospora gaudefroyi]